MVTQRDIWQSRYYIIPRIYMTIVGIWPYQTTRNRYLHFVPTFTFCFSIFLPQTLYLLIGSTDIDDIFECVPSILITIVFSFKLGSMIINTEKITACLAIIEEDWHSLKTDIEKTILRQHVEYGYRLTLFYAALFLMTAFFYLLKPIVLMLLQNDNLNSTMFSIRGASKLPFHVEYGEKLDQHFYLILCHCYLAVFSHVLVTVANDSFYYTLIQHACGMFSIVGYMLENIGKDNDDNFHLKIEKIDDDNYNKALKCLRKHLHVIKFAKLIESTFTKQFLVSINLNVIVSSICGIQVLMNLNDTKDILAPLAIYIAQLTHLFLQFWQAQFLLDYSVIPYESICRANWYYTSKRCRKILMFIMNRTMLPCKITAGKIVTLSIESFAAVLKTSMSYFTVLRSFH